MGGSLCGMAAFVKKGSGATPFSLRSALFPQRDPPMHHALLSFVVALGFIAAGSLSHIHVLRDISTSCTKSRSYGTRDVHDMNFPKPRDNYGGGPVGGELVCVNKAD